MALVEYDLLGNRIDKVDAAIKRLKAFEPPEGYYLCFSGGKDSVCIKALADMAGVKYDAHYNVTTVDPPELVRFIAKYHPDIAMDKPERSMRQMIIDHCMPPTRRIRYCCAELKESKSEGRISVTGVRWAESIRRRNNQGLVTIFCAKDAEVAKREGAEYSETRRNGIVMNMDNDETRRVVEQCYRTHTTTVNPIIDWEWEDVWEFIHTYNLPYCSLYDEGYERLGCIGCPMISAWQREQDFQRWPSYRRMYISAFDTMLKHREELGKKNDRWPNAEAVMDVWVHGPKQDVLEGQMSIDDLDGIE